MKKLLIVLLVAVLGQAQAQVPGSSPNDPQITIVPDTGEFVPNEFVGSFNMLIHLYKNGKEDKDSPMNMRLWSTEEMVMIQPMIDKQAKGEMRMLSDLKNKYQYMLMTDEQGNRTGIKMPKQMIGITDKSGKDMEMKTERTSETRTINGHVCQKYIGTNDDGVWTAWVAEDVKAPVMEFAKVMQGKGSNAPENQVKGFPMESTWEPKDEKEKMVMIVQDLKLGEVDNSVFDISAYEISEMPAMMFGTGQ